MKLSIALTGLFSTAMVSASPGHLCGDYSGGIRIEETCTVNRVKQAIEDIFIETAAGCDHSFGRELRNIAGASTTTDANVYLESLCEAALDKAIATDAPGTSTWKDIEDANVDLAQFFRGEGFLNLETGNLFNDLDRFDPDRYFYIGEDPRLNDHYPTTEDSYQAAQAIRSFLTSTADNKFLETPTTSFSNCQHQAAMCCWHRDRQYNDGNGACNSCDCVDRDPADNTNLCWTEDGVDHTAYPGEEEEGDIHCHGFAWSDDDSDVNTQAKWNNLFYVAMHDHLLERGYVESIADVQDMCGCIEDMSPVSRADCTEAIPVVDYSVDVGLGSVTIEPEAGSYRMKFEACSGTVFGTDERNNNDLAAFVNRLELEGKMSVETMFTIYEKLVGYDNTDNNDNENEDKCALAYYERFNEVYPVVAAGEV